jgi:preprotein translocase subunit SecE
MREVVQFLSQVRVELEKVVWPSVNDWIGSTIVVLFLIAIFSMYIFFVDRVFSQMASWIFAYYSMS